MINTLVVAYNSSLQFFCIDSSEERGEMLEWWSSEQPVQIEVKTCRELPLAIATFNDTLGHATARFLTG